MSDVEGAFQGRLGTFSLDAAFQIGGRGITTLTGPSGAGKSTLLRCIAGLERLKGRLVVEGEVWQDPKTFLPPHKRAVGMVFQDAALLEHLSVRQNLRYGLRRAAKPHAIAEEEVVDLLGLSPLLARAPRRLSGGERQRVALGRALLSQPRLLLMDEPLSSLDATSRTEILPYLERLNRTLAIPAIYVTHDAVEAGRLGGRRLFMEAGRIVRAVDLPEADAPERMLDGLPDDAVRRLALAAIKAGLPPA